MLEHFKIYKHVKNMLNCLRKQMKCIHVSKNVWNFIKDLSQMYKNIYNIIKKCIRMLKKIRTDAWKCY